MHQIGIVRNIARVERLGGMRFKLIRHMVPLVPKGEKVILSKIPKFRSNSVGGLRRVLMVVQTLPDCPN